jgi:nitrite reductase/ring-hydroxylating ferredoxin subunit
VLYRDKAGRIGLMQERCTHHAFPMVYGFVTKEGIACGRHGWEFDVEGNCFVIGYQSKIYPMQWANAKAYPVRIHAGLCWTYLGPDPAPPLPEHEMLTRQDGRRRITAYPELACNWLAADEAAPDAGLDGSGDVEPDLANLATPLDTGSLRLRMPVDDTHTWQVTIDFVPSPDGTSPGLDEEAVEVVYVQTEQESEPAANPTAAG